jgi:ABC-2 type transport system permease protein
MRYLRLFGTQLRRSLTVGMQYRWDFFTGAVLSLAWSLMALVPFHVAFHGRPPVAGWTYSSALVVYGWFTVLKGVLESAVNPSLLAVVEQIRQGTLDFVLLKPADSQFLVSTAKFELFRAVDVILGLGILVFAFRRIGHPPVSADAIVALLLLGAAIAVLYSLWILVVSAAFWVIRVDNLAYLFGSLFEFGRWPVTIFKGFVRFVFTFIIPLAIMTTYPAQALLGTLAPQTAALSLGGSIAFAAAARMVWKRAIGHYTSASS